MGSDLYQVGLNEYHELSKAKAIARAIAYGHPSKEANDFFVSDGIWLELNLSIRSIHPDVCVDWTPSFVTRIIDEGVTSWDNPKKIEYEKTPLRSLYPELWEMRFALNKKNPPVVLVVQAEYHPDPKARPKSYSKEDAVDVVAFINKQYAPNIKASSGWDSRAWPGSDDPRPAPVAEQRVRRAELRVLPYLLWFGEKDIQVKEKGQWKKLAKSKWKLGASPYFDTDGSTLLLNKESVTKVAKDWSFSEVLQYEKKGKNGLGSRIIRDKQGNLWISSYSALIQQDPKGNVSKLTTKNGLAGNTINDLCLDSQGRLIAATSGGLSMHRGNKWENLKEGLADKKCRQVVLSEDGGLWVAGFQGVTRIAPDGTKTIFKSRQGIDGTVTRLVPLPGGGAWISTYNGTFEISLGATKAAPSEMINRLTSSEISSYTQSGDALWFTNRDNLFCLRNGQKLRVYKWEEPYPDPKARYIEHWGVYAHPDGGLWVHYGPNIFILSKEDLAKIDATKPINEEVCPADSIPVFSTSKTKVAAKEKETTTQTPSSKKPSIDLKGKVVVLTGTLSITREEAEKKLKAKGAIIGSTLSAKTNYLLAGLKAGSKMDKAKSLGVAVIDEDALS